MGRRVADHVEVGRLALSRVSSSLSLSSFPRIFFVLVSIPVSPGFLAPLPLSLRPFLSLRYLFLCFLTLVLSLSICLCVFRGNGQVCSTDPCMACSCLLTPHIPWYLLSFAFLYPPSLSFLGLISLFLRCSSTSRSVSRVSTVFFAATLARKEEE